MLKCLLEEAHVHEHTRDSAMGLIGIGAQRERPTKLRDGSLVGEPMRVGPEKITARQVGVER